MAKKKRLKPPKPGKEYRAMWRIVDGAVRDAFGAHPDYLTEKGSQRGCARNSVVKRVVGSVLGFAKEQRGAPGEKSSGV